MADVSHRKLGVALGEGQKLVQWCGLVLGHRPDLYGTAMSEQAHLASLGPIAIDLRREQKLSTTHSLIPQWEEGED